MRPTASKLFGALVLFLSPALFASGSSTELGKKLSYDSPAEAAEAIRQIEDAVGLDVERQLLLRPYDESAVDTLIDALGSPFDEAKVAGLNLLALAVKQLDIPAEVLNHTIVPAARAVEERYRSAASAEEARLAELARRVLWHARVKAMTSQGQRLEFLTAQIENREDGYYYPFEALEYLADMGTQNAQAALEGKIAESQRRSMSGKLLEQVQVARREVEIRIRLREADAATQSAELRNALLASREDRSFAGQSFRVWVIREMAARKLEGLTDLLNQVSGDPDLEPRIRYEAEQARREIKGLSPRSKNLTLAN